MPSQQRSLIVMFRGNPQKSIIATEHGNLHAELDLLMPAPAAIWPIRNERNGEDSRLDAERNGSA
jgi:hypothetical protein